MGNSGYRKMSNKDEFRNKGTEWVFIMFSAKPTKSRIELKTNLYYKI